jgi:hypothetical protein
MTMAPPMPWIARARISDVLDDDRGGGADREQQKADDEHAAPAEPVAQGGARQEEDREREGVGIDDPLELGERRAELVADHR